MFLLQQIYTKQHTLCIHVYIKIQMASTLDLFPTILRLTDISLPNDRIIDGVDMSAILFDNQLVKSCMCLL